MPRKVTKSRLELQAELDEANDLIDDLQGKLDDIAGIARPDEDETRATNALVRLPVKESQPPGSPVPRLSRAYRFDRSLVPNPLSEEQFATTLSKQLELEAEGKWMRADYLNRFLLGSVIAYQEFLDGKSHPIRETFLARLRTSLIDDPDLLDYIENIGRRS